MGPLALAAIPAAIAAVGGIVNNIITNKNQAKAYREQQRYNAPVNQQKRLQEAGLSPWLMYQQGNPGNMATPGPAFDPGLDKVGAAAEKGIDNYVSIRQKNLDYQSGQIGQDVMKSQRDEAYWNARKAMWEESMAETENQRKIGELYADFPKWVETGAMNPQGVSAGYRAKMNELKRSISESNLNRIKATIDNLNQRTAIEKVKRTYAEDYGMVGGDWTQGMGLLRSLGGGAKSLFKGTRAVPESEKALINSYRKYKGQQNTRDANRFLFEQLKH